MDKEHAFNIGLPKWPQCIIKGKSVTPEQATEIIRRTDGFFEGYGGNDHDYNNSVRRMLGCPMMDDYKNEDGQTDFCKYFDACHLFREKWGFISLEYLINAWVSCSWIGGPHGFCHPDGTIEFHNNIGKWPSVNEVYDDLVKLGAAFPFLDLTCTLMNGEEGSDRDIHPLVTMVLQNGEVTFRDTVEADITVVQDEPLEEQFRKHIMTGHDFEKGLPMSTLKEWIKYKPDIT